MLLNKYTLAAERVFLTLWVGSLWVTGFVVAPALFALLDDRALAGTVAGNLFTTVSYIGLLCAAALLLVNLLARRGIHWRVLVILAMLALVVVGQFVLSPMITELRQQGLAETARFGQLHGLSGVIYLLSSLLGLVLVAAGQPPRDQSSSS
ncbi:MAG: DUF4149 domain-containing protein [Gammaproteobacteria bacterium]